MTTKAIQPPNTAVTDHNASAPYRCFPSAELKQNLAAHSEEQLKLFLESWEDLPVDSYMKDGADYRRRRYGSFHWTAGKLVADPAGVFHQTQEVNSLHGGVDRAFPPLSDSVLESGVLDTLIHFFMARLPGEFDPVTSGVGVHQIRITATRDADRLPAPEGVHEDGHHFVAQVLMRRTDIDGGESQIFDRNRRPIYRTTLREAFESIVIDDRRVFHGVSAIRPVDGVRQGIRDMLLIDYFPVQGHHAGA
ncbi:hypothetical protein B1H19_04420 [Streptomyces gilvosporeus]|uniref:2OG-Fe dioxygenase family protein n=1 Tax=Streptomyces gilvosporeus TaxID=553510 RepID=A0A1V0TKQ2_9ACTN|nr:hypothetical protein B1H19_04420 [Streptomyces gilvosporeus]